MTVLRHPNNNGVTLSQWRKTAAGGETSLSGTDDFSAGLSYTVGAEQVFVNGVLIERGVDYTASTGTTVTGLTALVAGDIVTVSSPSAFNVANAIPKATITAKGDLLVGTGASTPANLAVGADGSTLVANSSASTGVSWAGPIVTAGKNVVINGGMDIFQRSGTPTTGLSVTPTTSTSFYGLDRWQIYAASANRTVSRQVTGDTTNLPFIQYCQRIARNSGDTNTGTTYLAYTLETSDSIKFAGKVAMLSFYARAGANYSSTSGALGAYVYSGTGTDQNLNAVFTGQVTAAGANVTLTTTWQRFTVITNSIATNATQLGIQFQTGYVGTALAADYYEITGVQLEVGSVATPFARNASTLQGELAACQRYYVRFGGSAAYAPIGQGVAYSSTASSVLINLPVQMRTTPSSLDYSSLALQESAVSGVIALSATPTFSGGGSTPVIANIYTSVASGLTQFRPDVLMANNSTSAYLGFSAEL